MNKKYSIFLKIINETSPRLISFGLLLLRCTLGILLFIAGSGKLFGWFSGYGIKATLEGFSKIGISIPLIYLSIYRVSRRTAYHNRLTYPACSIRSHDKYASGNTHHFTKWIYGPHWCSDSLYVSSNRYCNSFMRSNVFQFGYSLFQRKREKPYQVSDN